MSEDNLIIGGLEVQPGFYIDNYRYHSKIGFGGWRKLLDTTRAMRLLPSKFLKPIVSKLDEDDSLESLEPYPKCITQMLFRWTHTVISTDIPTLLWNMSKARTYTKKSDCSEIYHSQNDGFEYEKFLIDLSKGLAHIHSHGVVHRDFKPSNILIDEEGRCIITDFGIVKELNSDVEKSTVLVGTWAYASPEQITYQELDHRSDLYSLGIILYAMLCSRRPFAASNMAGYSKLHSEQPPRPPSDFIPRSRLSMKKSV